MIAAGIKTPVPLKELELHLRDEIERQMKSRKSEVEAFETAIQKNQPQGWWGETRLRELKTKWMSASGKRGRSGWA